MDNPRPNHILITGGTRSGKSSLAEKQAALLGAQVVYLATAEANDEEMAERISRHQQRRPPEWLTIEAPFDVIKVLQKYQQGYTILMDCLTMYLSNLYLKYMPTTGIEEFSILIQAELNGLAEVIAASKANLIIVTNEVGWGIVPDNVLARTFRDLAGLANQQIAGVCDQVYLVVSGIPLKIKGVGDCLEA